METFKSKYEEYFLPALCFVTGMLAGLVLGSVMTALKGCLGGGKITVLSNNRLGSGNGCGNSAADILAGGQKTNN